MNRPGWGVRRRWSALSRVTPASKRFDVDQTANLPEPVRRWLRHAIAVDTPLWTMVELTMRGHIKIGTWREFSARQILVPGSGFIWTATARIAGLPVTGFDRYSDGTGRMRWRILGLVPVQSAVGPDITRSAAGRLAAESICWMPTAFHTMAWQAAPSHDDAVATQRLGAHLESVAINVDQSGQLTDIRMTRWGNPDGTGFGDHPFGAVVEAERCFGPVTIPSSIRAGWWWGTDRQDDGEFFRADITAAAFR